MEFPLTVVEEVDFGKLAAENDIGPAIHTAFGRGLERYFVESDDYKRVRSGANTIVLGNRGSGKSAIFQILARAKRSEGDHVIELSPDDYSYEMLQQTMEPESKGSWVKQGAYAAAWKYVIYVLVMKEVTRKGQRLKQRGAASRIYRYVQDNHPSADMGMLSMLISYVKSIESFKIGPGGIELSRIPRQKARDLASLYDLGEIMDLLPALREVLARERVFVFIDELDRGWDSSEDAQAFVAGLFQACVQINMLHENLRVYISLRKELYASISALSEDTQKYRDSMDTIQWTEESLLNLIAKRIRYSVEQKLYKKFVKIDDITCWSGVFAAPPGGSARDSFTYMIDRTLYRPREIILFCTRVVEAVRSTYGIAAELPLPFAAIQSAERIYSGERAEDIAGEYGQQYPGLQSVFEVFRGRSRAFDRDTLQMLCLELATGGIPTDDKTSSWLSELDPDKLIDILWRVGFLVARPVGDTASINSIHSFLGTHQAPHLNLAAAQHFRVHPMFWSYLGLETETLINENVDP
jgi:hypothetical protein